MVIPLAMMFAEMARQRDEADRDLTKFRMLPGAEQPRPGNMPMRPPGQEGPMAPGAPPVDPRIIARMFEAMQK
jgi:hypothetical protein